MILAIAVLSLFLLLLAVAFTLWNLTVDYRKLDCGCEKPPGYAWLVCRALWQSVRKRQGATAHAEWRKALDGSSDSDSNQKVDERNADRLHLLQKLSKTLRMDWLAMSIPPQWLSSYSSVCCCSTKDSPSSTTVVPVCFPETLFFKQMVLLVTSSRFPVSPLGLIHVKQVIRAYEPLTQLLQEPVDLRTEVSRVETVAKGIEIDFTSRVFLRGRDICIWEGVTTLLSRNTATVKRQTKASTTKSAAAASETREADLPSGWMTVHVPGSIGLQYAQVTGDYNPHHLYPWTARLLGYRKPMAHGMWTLQRALQCVKETCPGELQHIPLAIEANFRRPLYLPSTMRVSFSRSGPALQLNVSNAEDESDLHVEVTVRHMA